MYISKVNIRNFRSFDDKGITAVLKEGVNAIIGENNSGKSSFVDAIRLALGVGSYKKDIYFSLSDFHINAKGQRSNTANIDIYFDDVPADLFEIWDPEDNKKGELHVCFYTVASQDGKEKIRYQAWGGPVEGNTLSVETLESVQTIYLGALRDANNELRPTRTGKLSTLFTSIVNTSGTKTQVLSAAERANLEIESQPAVTQLRDIINKNLSVLEQDLLCQKVGVGLVSPTFESIAASLRAWLRPRWVFINKDNPVLTALKNLYSQVDWDSASSTQADGVYFDIWTLEGKDVTPEITGTLNTELSHRFEITQNGLGYNNLLFMAAVLGDIENSTAETVFNVLLVEEPEAHLHPQLQELTHSFFEQNSNKKNVQVIYTSHSPTLVSRIGIDKIVLLYENNHRINCLSLSQSGLTSRERDYLERYLDVTKSQMLFAKGIVFVEGICEALTMPAFSSILNRSFDQYAVTVVNANGVSFEPFVKLLCYANSADTQTIKAAVLTDDDRCTNKALTEEYISKDILFDCSDEVLSDVIARLAKGTPSDRYLDIQTLCADTHISVHGACKTFEYALCVSETNLNYLLSAIIDTHPVVGKRLYNRVKPLDSLEKQAACLWLFMREHDKQKAIVAQALVRRINAKQILIKDAESKFIEHSYNADFVIPEYIKDAIFAVTKENPNVELN